MKKLDIFVVKAKKESKLNNDFLVVGRKARVGVVPRCNPGV
jgi:hypothetical protein